MLLTESLGLSAILFSIGVVGVLLRRNAIVMIKGRRVAAEERA